MSTMLDFIAGLDKAMYVRFIPDENILFTWHGGITVNVYAIGYDGQSADPTDAFTFRVPPSIDMIDEHINEYVAIARADANL